MRSREIITSVAFLGALVILAQSRAPAAEAEAHLTNALAGTKRQWTASVRWENDIFAGTDRYYTEGLSLGMSHTGPSWMDPVADWLPWGQGRRTVGYDVTQAIFTPNDLTLANPDPKDWPYAGILAVGLTLHVERSNSYHGLKFITGVLGPWALAEQAQQAAHHAFGGKHPEGWSYQLHNEPIFNLAYEYRHKFRLAGQRERWSVEGLPMAAGWLGNVLTEGEIGGLVRFGYNMPNDFGPTLMRGMGYMPPPRRSEGPESGSEWGFAIHGGAFANLILRDITLDGNTLADSRSVDKNPFVPVAAVGFAFGNRRFLASFSYVFWGQQFEGQHGHSEFGSAACTYFF